MEPTLEDVGRAAWGQRPQTPRLHRRAGLVLETVSTGDPVVARPLFASRQGP